MLYFLSARGASSAAEWRQKSILLKNKSQMLREKAHQNMTVLVGLEEEEADDIFSESDESDYDNPSSPPKAPFKSISFNLSVEDFDHPADSVSFEDHDFSKPPPCLIDLGKGTSERVEGIIRDNLKNGALPRPVREEIKTNHMLSENEIDDIIQYIMTRMGFEHDHAMIENFHTEIEDKKAAGDSLNSGKPMILGHEQLPLILELKSELHRLRNEHRVERTMKLWSTMRVKLRDRALKEMKQAADLHRQETQNLRMRLDHESSNTDSMFAEMRKLQKQLEHEKNSKRELKDEVRRLRRRESLAVVESAQRDSQQGGELQELRNQLNVERMKRQTLSEQLERLQENRDDGSSNLALRKMKKELELERQRQKDLRAENVRLQMGRESSHSEGHLRVIQNLEADLIEERTEKRNLEAKLLRYSEMGDQERLIRNLEADLEQEKREKRNLEKKLLEQRDDEMQSDRILSLELELEREKSTRKRLESEAFQRRTNGGDEDTRQELKILQESLEKERSERQRLSAELVRIRKSGPPKAETSDRSEDAGVETLSEVSTMLDDLKYDMDKFHETCKAFIMRGSASE